MTDGYSAFGSLSFPLILPPTTDADRISWVQLIRSRRVGPRSFFRLIGTHKSADEALKQLPNLARDAGISGYKPCSRALAEAEYSAGLIQNHRFVAYATPDYPILLSHIPDPPPYLWIKGQSELAQKPMIALVGARNASSLGVRMARRLAHELGEKGFITVSGLARGIDTASHQSSLDMGTIAVMAGGLDTVYPQENINLAQRITKTGWLISEHWPQLSPQARHFPQRNRIISGLCVATVVIEGAARSGSLITARLALTQGREVMAVPGNPMDGRAGGCNILIRDGALLVRCAQDILDGLPQNSPPSLPSKKTDKSEHNNVSNGTTCKGRVLPLLSTCGASEDLVIRETKLSAGQVADEIADLEMAGQLERQPGGLLARRI